MPFSITTYDQGYDEKFRENLRNLQINDSLLSWQIQSSPFYGKCYTLTLSQNISQFGIKELTIKSTQDRQYGIFFHTFGFSTHSWDIRVPGFLAKSSGSAAGTYTYFKGKVRISKFWMKICIEKYIALKNLWFQI